MTVHELSRVDAQVNAVHQDMSFDKAMTAAVAQEIKDLAHWLELELMPR